MLWLWWLIWEFFYFQFVWPHIKYKKVGGRRHRGRRVEPGGDDQGGCWHEDASHQKKFSSKRTLYCLLMVVDMKLVYSFNMSDLIKYMWVGRRRHCGRQGQQGSQSWMLNIRFHPIQKTLALVVILRCVLPMWDLWFKRVIFCCCPIAIDSALK